MEVRSVPAALIAVFLDHYLVLFPEESALLPQVGTISTVGTFLEGADG
jgi:hypothetical protein